MVIHFIHYESSLPSVSYLAVAALLKDDGSLESFLQNGSLDGLYSLALRSPNEAHDVIVQSIR